MRKREYLFYKAIANKGIFPSINSFRYYMKMIFRNTSFENKSILDIGGGSGILSYYAVLKGAVRAVCVDPYEDGSSLFHKGLFSELDGETEFLNVELLPIPFNNFDPKAEVFDIILLHNSINHLDEKACTELRNSSIARTKYSHIFAKIKKMLKPGGEILICDCTSRNFFSSIKLRNSFAPSIEWEKHQPPEIWIELLKDHGFIEPTIKWNSPKTLGAIGNFFLGNRLMAYFLTSHFCLKMKLKEF